MIIIPQDLDILEHDFFELNPEYKFFNGTNTLIKNVGPLLASKVMWAIYLTEDPDSAYYGLELKERRELIQSNYLKNEDFDWDEYKYVITDYPKMLMTPAKRRYKKLNDNFDKMLEELEGEALKDAANFYKSLESMYKGLLLVESQYNKQKQREKEQVGSSSGKFG